MIALVVPNFPNFKPHLFFLNFGIWIKMFPTIAWAYKLQIKIQLSTSSILPVLDEILDLTR